MSNNNIAVVNEGANALLKAGQATVEVVPFLFLRKKAGKTMGLGRIRLDGLGLTRISGIFIVVFKSIAYAGLKIDAERRL